MYDLGPEIAHLRLAADPAETDGRFAEGNIDCVALFDEITAVAVEITDNRVPGGSTLSVSGWAIDIQARVPVDGVCVRLGDTLVEAVYGELRADVATIFGEVYAFSGFRALVSLPPDADGSREISAIVVDGRCQSKYLLPGARTIVVEPTVLDVNAVSLRQRGVASMHFDAYRVDNSVERTIGPDLRLPRVMRGSLIDLLGWAYDTRAGYPARAVYGLIDGRDLVRGVYGQPRPDVAQAHGADRLSKSGFRLRLDTAALTTGTHSVHMAILCADGSGYDIAEQSIKFEVVPDER